MEIDTPDSIHEPGAGMHDSVALLLGAEVGGLGPFGLLSQNTR